MYHKDFPWQKGLWIWRISECLDGSIDSIITKCHNYDISYLLIKNGDGPDLWQQLNRDVVTRFQNAGIKVYSWGYNYGKDPQGEADVAIKCLDLGVNGHVFDAEAEYRDAPNNAQAAELMLKAVRAKHPDKFLAHAPLAIIDYHTRFPYVIFGKYCDAVMPQIYFGTMKKTPQQAILWTYDNFVRWQKNWRDNGYADSVKPIIPIGQTYDNYQITPPYILTPADIQSFIKTVAGYKSVNFWSFQHILRDDCWAALRDAKVDAPSDAELGRVVVGSEQTTPVEVTTEAPQEVVQETVVEVPVVEAPAVEPPVTVVEPVVSEPAPEPTVVQPEVIVVTAPQEVEFTPVPDTTPTTVVVPQSEPQRVELPTNISIPATKQPTTVTFKPNKADPEKFDVIVHGHKTHREYFVEFVQRILLLIQNLLQDKRIRR